MRCGMDDSMNRRTDEALDVAFLEHLSSVAREREAAARVEHTSAHVFVHVGLPLDVADAYVSHNGKLVPAAAAARLASLEAELARLQERIASAQVEPEPEAMPARALGARYRGGLISGPGDVS